MKVVVRSVNSQSEGHKHHDCVNFNPEYSGRDYLAFRREEFHMVDLELNELYRDFLPPQVCCTGVYSMELVPSDDDIFLIGGVGYQFHKRRLESLRPTPEKQHLFYRGGAKISLIPPGEEVSSGGKGRRWVPFPLPINNRVFPICAPLLGKIYSFGYDVLRPEVYDPSVGHWELLPSIPSELDQCGGVSKPVVPDPSHSRILVRCKGGSLYAFYPDDARWECLSSRLFWNEAVAVVDDLIFFPLLDYDSSTIVTAYDLRTQKWLDIVWDMSSIDQEDFRQELRCFLFTWLFSLKDGSLCLAHHHCDNNTQPPLTNLLFLRFSAMRKGTDALILTALSRQAFVLESTSDVLALVPL